MGLLTGALGRDLDATGLPNSGPGLFLVCGGRIGLKSPVLGPSACFAQFAALAVGLGRRLFVRPELFV